jgi:hypothetical protein
MLMETLSKPPYVVFFLLIVFCIGMSSGVLWAKGGARLEGFFDASKSIKASVLPLGDGKFVFVAKDREKFTYKFDKDDVEVDISRKNALFVVDLAGNEVGEIKLKEGFDLANAQFIYSKMDKIYFFEGKNSTGQFIPRR